MKCELCGVEFIDGTYRFSFKSEEPVHPDAVYTRICKSAIEANATRRANNETDLLPIDLDQCINVNGKYNSKYRWLKPNESI